MTAFASANVRAQRAKQTASAPPSRARLTCTSPISRTQMTERRACERSRARRYRRPRPPGKFDVIDLPFLNRFAAAIAMSQALLSAIARIRSDYVISVYADYGASILARRCSVPGLGAALARVFDRDRASRAYGARTWWRDRVRDGIHRKTRRLSPWSETIVVNPMLLEAIEGQGSYARGTHRLPPASRRAPTRTGSLGRTRGPRNPTGWSLPRLRRKHRWPQSHPGAASGISVSGSRRERSSSYRGFALRTTPGSRAICIRGPLGERADYIDRSPPCLRGRRARVFGSGCGCGHVVPDGDDLSANLLSAIRDPAAFAETIRRAMAGSATASRRVSRTIATARRQTRRRCCCGRPCPRVTWSATARADSRFQVPSPRRRMRMSTGRRAPRSRAMRSRFRSPPTSRNGAWHPSFVSASVACQPIDALRFVASLIQSAVETQLGLANRLHSNAFVFDVTGRPNALVRLDGSAYATQFSDGNRRVGYFGSAALGIPNVAGLSFALRSRGFAGRTTQQLVFSERARIRSWIVSVQSGVGRETAFISLGARGQVGGCLTLDTSASNSTSALASAAGYRRTSASIALSCRL